MSETPPEFIEWAQKWIEAHQDKWWDPWGKDLHHDLAAELIRQMQWSAGATGGEEWTPKDGPAPVDWKP